jgi:hypothetical protein
MIAHVVLFQPRADLTPADRRAFIEAFETAVTQIDSIRRWRIGRRVVHGRPYETLMKVDYGFAAVLEFDDIRGLKRYLEHPAHEQLGAAFFSMSEAALVYDFDLVDEITPLLERVD